MIPCLKCSAENDDAAKYCDQCGTALNPELHGKALPTPCPACSGEVREVPSIMAVCQRCGLSLGEAAAAAVEAPPVPAEPEAVPAAKPPEKAWPCPICALENPVDAALCADCGIVFKETYKALPCPRCKTEARGDKCSCGTILTLSKLVEFVDETVHWVCPTCKQLYTGEKKECPDCRDTLEPADDLKDYAAKSRQS
jgi:predicted Zn-ribbon and HTH transcriptional regulator